MNTQKDTLRFAIMLQDETLKKWQSDVIEKLCNSSYADPVLLILNDGYHYPEQKKTIAKPNILWRIYEKFYLRKGPLKNTLLPDSLSSCIRLKCKVEKKGKFSEFFLKKDLDEIKKINPDFIIRFGFSIIRGEILDLPKYGIWSFHHSDEKVIRGGPAGFWEVCMNHSKNGVILQKLTNHLDGGIILKKRYYKTIMHDCAFHIHHILDSSTDMPVQVCADILNQCADYFQQNPSSSEAKIYSWPGLFKMSFFPLLQMWRRIMYNLRILFIHEKWITGIAEAVPDDLINNKITQCPIKVLNYKSKHVYPADPFIINTENGKRIFFEKFNYAAGKADIRTVLFEKNKGFSLEKIIFDNAIHRSFPFVFSFDGKTYLMPEQIENKCVDLYLWNEKDEKITFSHTILQQPLADAVLLYKDNIWWLFGSVPGIDVNNSLCLFYSDDLLGPYISHPQNPIVYSPSGARMAGSFINQNGNLFRLGQDSQNQYGKQTLIFHVKHLSKIMYKEDQVSIIQPVKDQRFKKGLHTINFCPPFMVFDGKKYVFSLSGLKLRLKQKTARS